MGYAVKFPPRKPRRFYFRVAFFVFVLFVLSRARRAASSSIARASKIVNGINVARERSTHTPRSPSPTFSSLLFYLLPLCVLLFPLLLPHVSSAFFFSLPERFHAASSPARSSLALGFDDLLFIFRIYIPHRVSLPGETDDAMTCGWRS